MTDAINIVCPKCRSGAGDQCRDRYARPKPTCKDRETAASRWYAVSEPAPQAPAAKPDDFDEATPPPRGRPVGDPIPRYMVVPRGQLVIDLFREWDKEGRIPATAALVQATGKKALVMWCNGQAKPEDLDDYAIGAWIVVKPSEMPTLLVLVPREEKAFLRRKAVRS